MLIEHDNFELDCGCAAYANVVTDGTITKRIVTSMCEHHETRWINSTIRNLLKEAINESN